VHKKSDERVGRSLPIIQADKLARALGLTLAGLFAELERRAEDGARQRPAP